MDIDYKVAKDIIKPRAKNCHKGDFGKVLIIAGSKGMAGAAILAARSSVKSGAGLTTVSIHEEHFNAVHCAVPEVTCIDRNIKEEELDKYDAIGFGPGLSVNKEDKKLLIKLLKIYQRPLIIDADGINIIEEFDLYQEIKETKARVVITPHTGESHRLIEGYKEKTFGRGKTIKPFDQDYLDKLSKEEVSKILLDITGGIVVQKGPNTVIMDQMSMYKNLSGNPGMATGGTGDVLTGLLTSFLGQCQKGQLIDRLEFDNPETITTALGVFVHGLAGDIAAKEKGELGMTAQDVLENIPFAIKKTLG